MDEHGEEEEEGEESAGMAAKDPKSRGLGTR